MTILVTPNKVYKLAQIILLVAILGLSLWSQPWNTRSSSTTRKITVSGQSTIEAEPDEFVFSPYFQQSGTDSEALKNSLNEKANSAVAKLMELGVEEKDIKLDSSSYDYWYYQKDEEGTLTISLQVTVNNKDKAQEVQDYFQTLDMVGQLSPRAVFSKDKQKELDAHAVEEATSEARAKAEAQAKLLGAKVGKVIEVNQGYDSVFPIAYDSISSLEAGAEDVSSSIPVLPGQNDYTQTVTVVYELQ
jgi:uncharacterized protein YggE